MISSEVREILQGGYDLHVHTIPSHFPRIMDDFELVSQCENFGMAGAMVKSHYEPTAARAELVNRNSGAVARLYGGVVLNWPVGGLNPYAVESTLKMGGKIIWLPTRDSENCLKYGHMNGDFFDRPPVSVTGENGKPVKAFYDVLEVIKKYNGWLATGHISPEESILICREARAHGVNTILTHPDWDRTRMSWQQQAEIADMGVMIEKVWGNVLKGHISAEAMVHSIQMLGSAHVYLVSDLGQKDTQLPADGMAAFVSLLLDGGIPAGDIKTMLCDNPKRIVG